MDDDLAKGCLNEWKENTSIPRVFLLFSEKTSRAQKLFHSFLILFSLIIKENQILSKKYFKIKSKIINFM